MYICIAPSGTTNKNMSNAAVFIVVSINKEKVSHHRISESALLF